MIESTALKSNAISKLKTALEEEEKIKQMMMKELTQYKKKVQEYKGDLINKENQLIDADGDNNFKNANLKENKVKEAAKIDIQEKHSKEESGKQFFYTNSALANGNQLKSTSQRN